MRGRRHALQRSRRGRSDGARAPPACAPTPERTRDRGRHRPRRRRAFLQSDHRRARRRRNALESFRESRLAGAEFLAMKEGRWLLLIHQLPPKPDYFRVKIWRRLQRIGAVAIKSSVYVLPYTDQATEDFQWLRREIVAGGGEASVCQAAFVDGLSDGQIEALFRAQRDAEYAELAL